VDNPASLTVEVVRARDSKGRYRADDPTTIENEAYTLKKKKPAKK
jgi:hypothetical protein